MSWRNCCKDPTKCGHAHKNKRYANKISEETIEYDGCEKSGLPENMVYGREALECPFVKGENK